jgi:hypothetical protein
MAQIIKSFLRYADSDLSVKADYILVSMTGNANFANPEPPLAAVQTALDAYNAALTASKTRNAEQVAIKNEKRAVLEGLLTKLALWVQLHSDGSEAVLLSSGFDLAKKRVPVGILAKPQNFVAKAAVGKGSVRLSLERIHGADSYVFEYAKAPVLEDTQWQTVSKTRASALITNLSSGHSYVFRAVAIGANPVRVYSDEVSTYVL